MDFYHYAILERAEQPRRAGELAGIDMENLDYKRQPDVRATETALAGAGGLVCGIWRGGMFGLATNQIAILSAWGTTGGPATAYASITASSDSLLREPCELEATVRPTEPHRIERPGFYVIRWIRMLSADIEEYTRLCLETWPAFEAPGTARCYGVFRPRERGEVSKLLMLTWYASMHDWERTRRLEPADRAKWARRSEMELSHWGHGARLALSRAASGRG